MPRPGWAFWPWVIDGALAQVAATALMLIAMGERSFVITIAYLKTEPIQVAIFGFIFLGDAVTWPMAVAIFVATVGFMAATSLMAILGEWTSRRRQRLSRAMSGYAD